MVSIPESENAAKQALSNLKDPEAFTSMIAKDKLMASVFQQAESIAPTDYSVVISGESGTGKEMLARIIHDLSSRSKRTFLAVNMGAFGQTLFEDAFFGHNKGAYTGASYSRKGFFEVADGGTLLLDEITELEIGLQGKLLRVLQERELYRLGSTKLENVDVRIIATTNRDIGKEIDAGRFRSDLFYRLSAYCIEIPPLRKRKEDILPLADHFLKIHAKRNGKEIDSLDHALSMRLLKCRFPGNVRELESKIITAVIQEEGNRLTLSSARSLFGNPRPIKERSQGLITMSEVERSHILNVLDEVNGNQSLAAEVLGIGLRTLNRKIQIYRGEIKE